MVVQKLMRLGKTGFSKVSYFDKNLLKYITNSSIFQETSYDSFLKFSKHIAILCLKIKGAISRGLDN